MGKEKKQRRRGPGYRPVLGFLGRLWFRLIGWTVVGDHPDARKFVMIAAPHTTNWDLVNMLGASWVLGLKVSWLGKDTIFKKPFAGLMKSMGGIPIDRSQPNGVVGQMAERFSQVEEMALAVPPAGTRKQRAYWKSGFYWIALTAKVPVVCGFLDYKRKEAGVGPTIPLTGDPKTDMDRIREFYDPKQGKFPDKNDVIRIKEEDQPEASSDSEQKA